MEEKNIKTIWLIILRSLQISFFIFPLPLIPQMSIILISSLSSNIISFTFSFLTLIPNPLLQQNPQDPIFPSPPIPTSRSPPPTLPLLSPPRFPLNQLQLLGRLHLQVGGSNHVHLEGPPNESGDDHPEPGHFPGEGRWLWFEKAALWPRARPRLWQKVWDEVVETVERAKRRK